MKILRLLALFTILAAGAIAWGAVHSSGSNQTRMLAAGDDPPPRPIECPLCGGDPALHNQRMAALSDFGAVFAFQLFYRRW